MQMTSAINLIRMADKNNITQDMILSVLSYNSDTGIFRWCGKRREGIEIGAEAGWGHSGGYKQVRIFNRRFFMHRLAWVYHYGVHPTGQIDHINGNRLDNRICNLREASDLQNTWNIGVHAKNTSGFAGVTWSKEAKKWRAQCSINKKRHNLGLFSTPEDASEAYKTFARIHRGEFYRETRPNIEENR